jgi:hypothetical protein
MSSTFRCGQDPAAAGKTGGEADAEGQAEPQALPEEASPAPLSEAEAQARLCFALLSPLHRPPFERMHTGDDAISMRRG